MSEENTRDLISKTVSEITGQSRSEAFKGFKDFTNGIMQAQTARRLSPEPIEQPIPQISSAELQSTGFSGAGNVSSPPSMPPGGSGLRLIAVMNGTGFYANFTTDGTLVPV